LYQQEPAKHFAPLKDDKPYRIDDKRGGIKLYVLVEPGKSVSQFHTLISADDPRVNSARLAIRLAARAKEGEANKALLAFLAKELALPKSSISLESGAQSQHKTIFLKGATKTLEKLLRDIIESLPPKAPI
jgi:uncharacterized protein YggU (UPF0235/DUF167 family)